MPPCAAAAVRRRCPLATRHVVAAEDAMMIVLFHSDLRNVVSASRPCRSQRSSRQVVAAEDAFPSPAAFRAATDPLRRGDVIGAVGVAGASKRGELSLFAGRLELLSPCLHMLPKHSLRDQETRYRQRYLDLIMNPANRDIFIVRSRVVQEVRDYLNERGFLEVCGPACKPLLSTSSVNLFCQPLLSTSSVNLFCQPVCEPACTHDL
jgi:hypothetical protein